MNETSETADPEATEQKPEPAEPDRNASLGEWADYVNQKYPRRGITAPGSHMGRR